MEGRSQLFAAFASERARKLSNKLGFAKIFDRTYPGEISFTSAFTMMGTNGNEKDTNNICLSYYKNVRAAQHTIDVFICSCGLDASEVSDELSMDSCRALAILDNHNDEKIQKGFEECYDLVTGFIGELLCDMGVKLRSTAPTMAHWLPKQDPSTPFMLI